MRGSRSIMTVIALIAGCATTKPYIPSQPPAFADTFRCDPAITYRPLMDPIPQVAIDKKISGWAIVSFSLDGSGVAQNISIERADPPGVFDEKVIRQLRATRFAEGFKKDQCKRFDAFLIECNEDCPDFSNMR